MENIILGLLALKPRTIYQLRKRIDEGLNLMYSCSTGSIQAAIKKLLKNGCIAVEEITENGKRKKLYGITDSGKAAFGLWINSPIDGGTAKSPELAKIYFMGHAEKERRAEIIEKHIAELKKIYSELDAICEGGESAAKEMQKNDTFFYQLQTAKYGRDLMKFNIEWYTRLSESIKER